MNGFENNSITVLGVNKKQALTLKNIVNNPTTYLNRKQTITPNKLNELSKRTTQSFYEYNSYFKMILVEQPVSDQPGANVDYYVRIVDGATYDETKDPVSGKSFCKVNNINYYIDPYISSIITESCFFALKYTAYVPSDISTGEPEHQAKVEIVKLKSDNNYVVLPNDTSKICWYLLGRVFVNVDDNQNKIITLQQDHQGMNGIPHIWWYSMCEE